MPLNEMFHWSSNTIQMYNWIKSKFLVKKKSEWFNENILFDWNACCYCFLTTVYLPPCAVPPHLHSPPSKEVDGILSGF